MCNSLNVLDYSICLMSIFFLLFSFEKTVSVK